MPPRPRATGRRPPLPPVSGIVNSMAMVKSSILNLQFEVDALRQSLHSAGEQVLAVPPPPHSHLCAREGLSAAWAVRPSPRTPSNGQTAAPGCHGRGSPVSVRMCACKASNMCTARLLRRHGRQAPALPVWGLCRGAVCCGRGLGLCLALATVSGNAPEAGKPSGSGSAEGGSAGGDWAMQRAHTATRGAFVSCVVYEAASIPKWMALRTDVPAAMCVWKDTPTEGVLAVSPVPHKSWGCSMRCTHKERPPAGRHWGVSALSEPHFPLSGQGKPRPLVGPRRLWPVLWCTGTRGRPPSSKRLCGS